MGKTAAIFDVDGTLVRGVTERLFFLYLLRHRRLNPVQALDYLLRLAAQPHSRFHHKRYLKGMDVEETVSWGRSCYQKVILTRLRPRGLACVRAHQEDGRKIVLLTGSLKFLMEPLQEDLGADWLIATELARQSRYFTGDILGGHPRGEMKRLLLKELARSQGLDLSRSYAYGDHVEDFFFLSSVGWPVAVNPSQPLRRLARERRWPIEYF